jgi:GT2 family glycosyltransferase
MKDLSIITVTHQSAAFIEDQVFSVISGAFKLSIEHIIIDNASSDGTPEVLDRLSHVLAKVMKNSVNIGFSAANNQALDFAQGRYLLFLNPDMRVKEGSLEALVEWMDHHPEVGLSSCMLVDPLGIPLEGGGKRDLPRLSSEILWLMRLNLPRRKTKDVEEVEMVKGAFMLVRKEIVEKLGFAFDPRYFLLYEDADLCREVSHLGYKIAFHSQIQCMDFNSRSFAVKGSSWIFRCFSQSMLRYFRKWNPWYCWIWIAILIPVGYILRLPSWKRKTL